MKLAVALAPLLLAVGCASGPTPPPDYLPVHVEIKDVDLSRDITLLTVMPVTTATGLTTVTVPVRSNREFPSDVSYQFTFLDKDEKVLETPPAWLTITLEPGAVTNLVGTCPLPGAVDYRVEIKPK